MWTIGCNEQFWDDQKVPYQQVWLYIIRYLFSVTNTVGLASGCPNTNNQNSQDMISTTQTGAVRCCSFDGGSCESKIPECSILTFSNAKQKCSEFGMRLCTEEELASNICCGTGCGFDLKLVWYTKGNLFRSTGFNQKWRKTKDEMNPAYLFLILY